MFRYVKFISVVLMSIGIIAFILNSCFHSHKYQLIVGDKLTPLGRFTYGPWEAHLDGQNVANYMGSKEVTSVARFFSDVERQLTFELLPDGSVKYWFKSDYDTALAKRLSPDKNGEVHDGKYKPMKGEIKKIYRGDIWKANYTDSAVAINFGKNDFGLSPLVGKYTQLGSDYFEIRQTSFFDSTYDGKPTTYRRVVTTLFSHPYTNSLTK